MVNPSLDKADFDDITLFQSYDSDTQSSDIISSSISDVERSSHSVASHAITNSTPHSQSHDVESNIINNIEKPIVQHMVANSIQQQQGHELTSNQTYHPSHSIATYAPNISEDRGKSYYTLQNVSSKTYMNNIQQPTHDSNSSLLPVNPYHFHSLDVAPNAITSNSHQIPQNHGFTPAYPYHPHHSSHGFVPHTVTSNSTQIPQNYGFGSERAYQLPQSFITHSVTNSNSQSEYESNSNRRQYQPHSPHYSYHTYGQPVSQPYYFQNQSYVQPQIQNMPHSSQTIGLENQWNNYNDLSSVQKNYYHS